MSEPWGGAEGVCPRCGSGDWMPADEGAWPSCNDCGHVEYDAETLALMAEVRREQAFCSRVLGRVPTYREAVELGLIKR